MTTAIAPYISVVSPVYNAEHTVKELAERIIKAVTPTTHTFEIIFVDDYSPDKSWLQIAALAQTDTRIKGIRLSRNFGQHHAITAGLDYARGEWIVVMDCDLQDSPEEIPALLAKAAEGYDIVFARRAQRNDSIVKKLFSKLFYRLLTYLTGTRKDAAVANFGIYNKKVVAEINRMKENIRYFPLMVKWVGFNSTSINVKHQPRTTGRSNYNFKRLLHLAFDIILAYSDKPLRLILKCGLFIAFAAFVAACIVFIQWVAGKIDVVGYASLIISIWFLSGCILITLGAMGLYIGKIFEGVKNRPLYIIDKTTK